MENTSKNKAYSRRFGITSAAMIVLTTVSVVFFNIVNSKTLTLKELVTPVFYILCFMFVFLFYIDSNKSAVMKLKISGIVICLCVLSSISGFYISLIPTYLPCFVLSTVLLAGIVDMNLGLLLLSGDLLFALLFFPVKMEALITAFLMSALLCVLSSRLKGAVTMLISIQITAAFYIVIKLLDHGFSLDSILKLPVMYEMLFYLGVLTINFFIRRALVKFDYSAASIEPAEAEPKAEILLTGTAGQSLQDTGAEELTAAASQEIGGVMVTDEDYRQRQILETEVTWLREENEKISRLLTQVMGERCHRVPDIVGEDFEYCVRLKESMPGLYKHCLAVAECAAEAAELIDSDKMLTYALGLYHEAGRLTGDKPLEEGLACYHLPENVVHGIAEAKEKPCRPIQREAGIVALVDDVYTALQYAKSKKRTDISADKIISNVFKVRREQKLFAYAGITVENQQLLKLFFSEEFGGSYDL